MKEERVVLVSSVLQRIKVILTQTFDFSTVWIQGEISNLTKHRSGHYYFSLKDSRGEMSCVMFSTYVKHLDFSLEEGMNVQVQGSVNVYEVRGSLQLYVKRIRQDGMGALFLEYQKRYKRLLEEGYFDQSHKKEKPEWFEHVAIITAKEGAALQDALKTIQRRWPMLKATLYPAYVQGKLASASLIKQIQKADQKGYDALLIIRGGGSFEDLFCFNDEELVKTLYQCKTYTVSGVGHEVDTTLCDLVCDHRAVTPTAAAQWITPDQHEIIEQLTLKTKQLELSMKHIFERYRQQYQLLQQNPYLKEPLSWAYEKQLKLDSMHQALEQTALQWISRKETISQRKQEMSYQLQKKMEFAFTSMQYKEQQLEERMHQFKRSRKQQLEKNAALLDAFSPLKTLSRGYSIATKDNNIIKSIQQVQKQDALQLQVEDGCIHVSVTDKEEKELWHKKS